MNLPETCSSNSTNASLYGQYEEVHLDVVKCSIGVSFFLLVLPFVLFYFKWFPISTTGAVLIGATLTLLTMTITQEEAYHVLGEAGNMRTICLLLGMMIMAQYFERELLAERLLCKILKPRGSFTMYLLAVTGFDFVLASIFTNDVSCVALTPLILTHWNTKRASKSYSQLSVLLLGIATSANIGSAATIFGNPQMALIASKTSQPLFDKSRLDMRRCVYYLWLPAVLCYFINFAFLLIYAKTLKWIEKKNEKTKAQSYAHSNETNQKSVENTVIKLRKGRPRQSQPFTQVPDQSTPSQVTNQDSVIHIPAFHAASNQQPEHHEAALHDRKISIASSVIAQEIDHPGVENWTPSNSRIFQAILCLGLITIIVLFLISNEKLHFDMGLIPMGVAVIAICADSLINKRSPLDVLKKVDWSVLLMFFGMFIWLYGLNKTNVPRYIWNRLNTAAIMKADKTFKSYFIYYAFIMICSNIFSNVPLTIIVLELLTPCVDELELVLYLGWVSTIAGNLTLFGSVANLIVAQKAHSAIGYRLGFFEYLRYGFVTTIVLSALGMVIIFGLLRIK